MEGNPLGAKGQYEMAVNRMVSAAAVMDGLVEDRKSTRLNSSHKHRSRMPSSA